MSNTAKKTTKTSGKFHALYNSTEKERRQEREPLERDRLKRKFQSAYDDALGKIMDAQDYIMSEYSNRLETLDINSILDQRLKIIDLEEQSRILSEEYHELFGEVIR